MDIQNLNGHKIAASPAGRGAYTKLVERLARLSDVAVQSCVLAELVLTGLMLSGLTADRIFILWHCNVHSQGSNTHKSAKSIRRTNRKMRQF